MAITFRDSSPKEFFAKNNIDVEKSFRTDMKNFIARTFLLCFLIGESVALLAALILRIHSSGLGTSFLTYFGLFSLITLSVFLFVSCPSIYMMYRTYKKPDYLQNHLLQYMIYYKKHHKGEYRED